MTIENCTDTDEWISVAEIRAQIAHIRENGASVKKFGGSSVDEGRCRELCAMYLEEFIHAKRLADKLRTTKSERTDGDSTR